MKTNEEVIVEKDNHKIFTTSLLKKVSDETTEYIKPEFASHKTSTFTPSEDLLSVIYGDDSIAEEINKDEQKDNNKKEEETSTFKRIVSTILLLFFFIIK